MILFVVKNKCGIEIYRAAEGNRECDMPSNGEKRYQLPNYGILKNTNINMSFVTKCISNAD